jgi:hypothetical protein
LSTHLCLYFWTQEYYYLLLWQLESIYMVVKHNHLVHNLFLRSQSIRTVSNLCISNPMASTNGKWFYYLSSPTQPSFVLCSLFILCAILFNQLVLTWQLLLSWSWVSAAPEKRNSQLLIYFHDFAPIQL